MPSCDLDKYDGMQNGPQKEHSDVKRKQRTDEMIIWSQIYLGYIINVLVLIYATAIFSTT